MSELMAAEVTELAGPEGKQNPARAALRRGTEQGTVTLGGGRRLGVRPLRVRAADGSGGLPPEFYATFTATDLLAQGIVARTLTGAGDPPGVALG
jgi:putative transposase